ncbi:MAG: diguanylate cyclase [Christensenellaceae bacterium]
MKKHTLFKVNLTICLIIIAGFIITSVISYRSNAGIYEKNVESVSTLASDGVYNEISSIFSQPINVSVAMANDSLLKTFVAGENDHLTDEHYVQEMRTYLNGYREKYDYDSVFFVSTDTARYYHFNGIDRILAKGEPEDEWYFDFLQSADEYSLNVDNDQATNNNITIFVNCKVKNDAGKIIGVVGVGLQVDSLQQLLKGYEDKYGIGVYLIDDSGTVQISSSATGYEKKNLFDSAAFANKKNEIVQNTDAKQKFWYSSRDGNGYVVSQYEPNLKWHLVVTNDMAVMSQKLSNQFYGGMCIIIFVAILVLFTITKVIKKYNVQITKLTISQELEYQRLLNETTKGLYESIYEVDITHNCAGGQSTQEYFDKVGASSEVSYEDALHIIAKKQVKQEYIEGYLNIFMPERVLEAYNSGITNLNYDFMIAEDGANYHWDRIFARIFYWNSDKSVRMIIYRKNIDEEKKYEFTLLEGLKKDSMTGLYNKLTTEELVEKTLQESANTDVKHAFLLLDIDNFKSVNDDMGHNFGDHVIEEISAEIKAQFREKDIVGRIGGDEFVILIKDFNHIDVLEQKLQRLCARLRNKDVGEKANYHVSCSIGVSLFPKDGTVYSDLYEKADQALYYAKGHGKDSFSIYGKGGSSVASNINQRDMEAMMNASMDGIAKLAYTPNMKMLYFNKKCAELTGTPPEVLSAADFSPFSQVHPDDLQRVKDTLEEAVKTKKMVSTIFRMRHYDGRYSLVKVQLLAINDLYENKYPILYAMYTKQEEL